MMSWLWRFEEARNFSELFNPSQFHCAIFRVFVWTATAVLAQGSPRVEFVGTKSDTRTCCGRRDRDGCRTPPTLYEGRRAWRLEDLEDLGLGVRPRGTRGPSAFLTACGGLPSFTGDTLEASFCFLNFRMLTCKKRAMYLANTPLMFLAVSLQYEMLPVINILD